MTDYEWLTSDRIVQLLDGTDFSDYELFEFYELYRSGGLPEYMLDELYICCGDSPGEVLLYTEQLSAVFSASE
jgi:hypothetical protein